MGGELVRLRGTYPTPVERLDALCRGDAQLWVKRDDLTHPLYGGNKVRKLERLLEEARARGKKRLVTVGAAGSHHVLATTVFGRRAGFEVDAVLVPQRRTLHVVANLRADLAQGLRPVMARTYVGAAIGALLRWRRDAYLIPMGGSNVVGSMGYVDAARELEAQVVAGAMPEPDWIVVTVGSGGTAAGLAAGLALTTLRTRVLGIMVAPPAFAVGALTRWLARRCHKRASGQSPRDAAGRLTLRVDYMGAGYGEPTVRGEDAEQRAAEVGLALDPTYTAKTFAAALDEVDRTGAAKRVLLYWHTLSSAPLGPLLADAPPESALDRRLLR
jgi:1-aminocyclopropane-1-carboxylate deaminase/D-cysteine desulfhydrase-like pyridoxal-dependent ACC family enzyme